MRGRCGTQHAAHLPKITDTAVLALGGMDRLESLDLFGTAVTPAQLKAAEQLPKLLHLCKLLFCVKRIDRSLWAFAMLVYNDRGLRSSDRTFH